MRLFIDLLFTKQAKHIVLIGSILWFIDIILGFSYVIFGINYSLLRVVYYVMLCSIFAL